MRWVQFAGDYEFVIPVPSDARSPESISPIRGYGFRARPCEPSQNDAVERSCESCAGRDVLAELAGDALWALGGYRLGVEDLDRLAVERGPGPGRRIAAADQPVDLLPRLAPVDLGVAGAAAAFVRGFRFILLDARRLAG